MERILPRKGSDGKSKLDLIDRRILSSLQADGRMAIVDLAERVGLSASPCWARVRRMEAAGVIVGYTALIDPGALGLSDLVFVEITLEKHDDKVLEQFGQALADIAEIVEAYLVTGDHDYLVKVAVSDTADYERFLREKLYRIKGIRHTRSTFSLRSLKRTVQVDPLKLVRAHGS
jgi:Lrp/AsnC family transcriptional regulator, leucine-responsive regulatory protein